MASEVILALDQGTTNSKAILLDQSGRMLAQGSSPLGIAHPQPGWVEQSADDIWNSVLSAIARCLEQAPAVTILGIGISNQRESVLCWNADTGEPQGPVVSWQCRRTTDATERLRAADHGEVVLAKTGLPLDPLFPATKIRWLMDNCARGRTCIGTVDSWLIWKLTGGGRFATDRSNASRTQLMDVRSGEWDTELCALFGVDACLLAEICDSHHAFGVTKGVDALQDGIPICSAIGDSHAALFGHAAYRSGEAKATFGTGSSVMMVNPDFVVPQNGMTTTVAWSLNGKSTYAFEGNILVSASLFPWMATLLGLGGDVNALMDLAATVEDTNGVSLVPALVGLGAPHWSPDARGLLCGLSFASTPAHVAHAAALSMSLQVVDVFKAMRSQTDSAPGRIFVDGGPTRNRFLMQQLSGLLAQPVQVSEAPELSALGAGLLAGLQTGFWSDLQALAALERQQYTVEPVMPDQTRTAILTQWQSALTRCLSN